MLVRSSGCLGTCIDLCSGSHLVDLITDHVSHLLLFLIYLNLNLSSQFLLLQTIEVANHLKSRLKDNCGHKSTKATDHVDNATANEVNKAKVLEPSFAPDPGGTHWVDNSSDVEGVNDMRAQVGSLSHG
jgi:hypothetical protein